MSISLDTYLTGFSTDAVDYSANKLTSQIQNASTDDETMEACKEFEAYMVQQMFKTMEESAKVFSEEEDENSGDYVEMFSDNYLQEIADSMVASGQGLGIAEQLYDSILKNQGQEGIL